MRTAGGNAAAHAPASPGRTVFRLLQHSELNRRGHEIREAAEHLLGLIDGLEGSSAEGVLYVALLDAAGQGGQVDVGRLGDLTADTAGFRWVLQTFIDRVSAGTIPLADAGLGGPVSPARVRS